MVGGWDCGWDGEIAYVLMDNFGVSRVGSGVGFPWFSQFEGTWAKQVEIEGGMLL